VLDSTSVTGPNTVYQLEIKEIIMERNTNGEVIGRVRRVMPGGISAAMVLSLSLAAFTGPTMAGERHIMPPVSPSSDSASHTPLSQSVQPNAVTNPLNNNGGPVQTAPVVYVVYWGWTGDPSGEQAYLNDFLSTLGGTSWLNTVTQYSGAGNPPNFSFASWSDPRAIPAQPTDAQVQAEALAAASHFGLGTSVNIQIVVATPSGHSTPGFGTQFCAYHGAVAARPSVTYTNLPYITDAGGACGANFVSGPLDGVSIVAGHELAEVITDPLLNAWIDSSGAEIGDKCAWTGLSTITTSAGIFAVQPLWSDANNGCVLASPKALSLIDGWTNAPFSTNSAAVQDVNGIVYFKGAIASGTGQPFVLPVGFTPATDVYVPVDLCNATNGRLHITPTGSVDVQAEGGAIANDQCFTSLDGASFATSSSGFTPLTLLNGWVDAPFATSNAAVQNINGIVYFKGSIASGSGQPFVLPAGFTPATDVYVPVDLCNATKGRLHITPSGSVDVQAEGGAIANDQCFTSLDGASFATSSSGFTPLTLLNGWVDAPFATSNAAVQSVNGIVYFKGAIGTGSGVPFVLPVGYRPTADVYVPIDLCNATNGRIHITPSGTADIEVQGGVFSTAQCFTSLDGAHFVQ
jgi:hypothetical protein